MRNRRGIRVAASVVWFITIAAGCVRSADQTCGGSLVCSAGTSCIELTREGESGFACASEDQLAACNGLADGMGCTVDGVDGSCLGGACLPSVCGDGINDPVYEKCDDGNVRSGDGCSGDCQSLETCGNNATDLAVGEQCDEGSPTLSGDGCSSQCEREYRLWRDVNPTPPPMRFGFGLATDPVRGVLVTGGGSFSLSTNSTFGSALFTDTWRWDDASWIELRSSQTIDARTFAAVANDAHGHVLVFGGTSDTGAALDDTLLWDGVTWKKLATGARPPARSGASLACATGAATLCILHGGQSGTTLLDDTWKWNGSTWTPLTAATRPSARRHGAMAYDDANQRFVLFGGVVDGSRGLADVWTFAMDTWTLRVFAVIGLSTTPTVMPSMAWHATDQRIMLLAQNGSGTHRTWTMEPTTFALNDFAAAPTSESPKLAWSLSPARMLAISPSSGADAMAMFVLTSTTWTTQKDSRPSKGAKKTPAAYDEARGVTVVFDGSTFEWNGVGWRMTTSGAQPPPTPDGLALAYQAQCGATIAFGGGDVEPTGVRNNITSQYKTAWSTLTAPGPTPRTRHAMTYDRARKAIVMFGGLIPMPTSFGNDTWELTTTDCIAWTWNQIQPTTRPPARGNATLVYDEKRGVSVLFGGTDANGERLNDTWEWDGTAWTQRMTPASGTPEVRNEHMAAYDPRRQRVILFGGRGTGKRLSDVWELDGAAGAWVRLAPAITPAARSGSGFALDITGNLVAINGDVGSGTQSTIGLIRLTSELSSEPLESCARASDDLDADGLAGCMDPDCWGRCAPLCPPGRTCAADAPRCGNTTCDPLEDHILCPGDCSPP